MGIIIKQSIKGSIWSYLGVIIGFVTTAILYPQYLNPEIVGLFSILVSISSITSQIASLGMNGVTARLFPLFRSKEDKHNGFVFLSLIVHLVGFMFFFLAYYLFKPTIINSNIDKSPLFSQYVFLIVPVTFFFMLFNFLDTYNRVLYDTVWGTFLQEFGQRALIFIALSLYILKITTLPELIISYAIAVSLKGVIISILLFSRKEISLSPRKGFINKDLRKEIIDVAGFSILGGLGSMVVFNIDKIVINQMLDLSNTGVYTIAFYFGTLVIIPSRPLLKISSTLIADAWTKNDLPTIQNIYYKSCINQFIIGGFLFLGIWANIDNILSILGADYINSKWVIFFIGLGYLFDMMTGANGAIISLSKYYRFSLYFILILALLTVVFLYSLIPLWGITGAAIAIALALFLNNLMRFVYLYRKYKMQPFNYKFIITSVFYIILYFVLYFIPQQKFILDLFIRSSFITITSGIFFLITPISSDIRNIGNQIKNQLLNIIRPNKNK